MHHVLWCEGTIDTSAHPVSHQYHQEATGWRWTTSAENIHDSEQHHLSTRILPEEYIFYIPGETLWTTRRSCYGLTNQPYSCKSLHGELWSRSNYHSTTPPYLWKRYVDDTFTIIKSSYRSEFLEHINSIDEHIQFTC